MAPLVRVSIIVVVVVVLLERVDGTPVQGNDRQAGAIRGYDIPVPVCVNKHVGSISVPVP